MHAIEFLEAPGESKIGPIVVVYGKDRFFKHEVVHQLIPLVLGADHDELSVSRLSGDKLELKTVVDSLLTVSMWSPKQIVIVEDADEFVSNNREGLENYLDRPAKKSILILDVTTFASNTRLAKKTASIGLSVECNPLKEPAVVGWVSKNCQRRHGKKIDRQAAQLMVELLGVDLGSIDQELAKLSAYVGNAPSIDAGAVERLVGGWKMETTWKMLDAVRDGNVGVAIELLDKLLTAGEHPLKLFGGINFVFRPIAKATELSRQGTQLNEALAQAGTKPFVIAPTAAYLKRITRRRAEQIYDWLLEADIGTKGASPLPEQIQAELLLLKLAGKT